MKRSTGRASTATAEMVIGGGAGGASSADGELQPTATMEMATTAA
jgi:hypothetical protein